MEYLKQILQKYQARNITTNSVLISQLKSQLVSWAGSCYLNILDSGSRAKGTAISLSSDIDFMMSLSNGCNQNNGGLEFTFNQLYQHLINIGYRNVRKQNVSIRITLNSMEIDITPATKHPGSTNDHNIWVSKKSTWQKTNIQKHITDIYQSGRTNEIRLIKIWRELSNLDFPSIYLEYLIVNNILLDKSKNINDLANNVSYIFSELSKDNMNPLHLQIVDPANTTNILSNLLDPSEKTKIINAAKITIQRNWNQVFY